MTARTLCAARFPDYVEPEGVQIIRALLAATDAYTEQLLRSMAAGNCLVPTSPAAVLAARDWLEQYG